MDRFLAPHTPEAIAYTHMRLVIKITSFHPLCTYSIHRETWLTWESENLSTLVAQAASYQAFSRYLTGTDLFLLPRTRNELETILYVHIHIDKVF